MGQNGRDAVGKMKDMASIPSALAVNMLRGLADPSPSSVENPYSVHEGARAAKQAKVPSPGLFLGPHREETDHLSTQRQAGLTTSDGHGWLQSGSRNLAEGIKTLPRGSAHVTSGW